MKNGGKIKTKSARTLLTLSVLLGGCSLVFLSLSFAVAHAVSFEDVSQTLGLGTSDLKETVINIINWALGLLGIIAVIFILYGGYMWLTAAGNEERVKRAKRILINTVIGLIIILLAWAIVAFVINFGNDVTNPGGDQCVEGTEQGCWDCVGGDWVYDGSNPGCSQELPEDTFEIRNIVTSCQVFGDFNDNVFLCSGVSIDFNKVVKTENLQSLVETTNPIALKVEQCSDANCTTVTQPNTPPPDPPLFNPTPPYRGTIEYSGSAPTGDRAEFVASGKAIAFLHAQQLFPPNTYFKLTIPKSIKSTTDKPLTACRYQEGSGYIPCTEDATTYTWIFRVGDQNDTQPPTLTESYPRSDPSNRDRNVSRTPIIWARFNEAIAPWTITEDNIKIYGFDPNGQPDDQGNGGSRLGTPIDGLPPDPDDYDVFTNQAGDGFELNFKNGYQLDAFRWYEIEVNNLEDMCSNLQSPAPLTWRFQTNGVGAGIAMVYPRDGYRFACPNTEVFVQFNTSMYDPATSSCAVLPAGGGFVTSGSDLPPRDRLAVEDDYPGSGDPNAYCKKYSYLPTENGLATDRDYQISVQTRYQINQQGDTLSANWGFSVKPPGECADGPYIRELSPNTGPAGTCLSVLGGSFDPDGDNQGAGDNDNLTFSDNSALNSVKRWSQNVIVANAPNFGLNGPSPVQVIVHHDPPIGDLPSNTVDFNYESGTFNGACLIQLNPDNGLRNQGYQLIGEDFNPASSVKEIHFGTTTACQNPPGSACWSSDTIANSTVPNDAPYSPPDSLVWIVNDAGASNRLPFTVNQVPSGTFQVVDFTPNCTSSCPNAAVRARFSTSLDPASVTNNTVELYTCSDATCGLGTLTEKQTDLRYTPGTDDVFFAQTGGLETPDVWYRAVIHGGSSGVKSAGLLELGDLNFDSDGTGGPDSTSWIFKTASNTETCDLNTVECHPPTVSIPVDSTRGLQSRAFSAPNSCNPAGQELDPWQYSWAWRSGDPSRVTVNPASPDPVTTATGEQPTLPNTPVDVTTATNGKNAICSVTVTTNTCVIDDDCVNNPIAGACTGSRCVDGMCTPTVTNISPTTGVVGDWVTVSGCYFDSYVDGRSKVLFLQDESSPDLIGLWPDPNTCGSPGSTWQDRQIIVEVPNKGTEDPGDDVVVPGPLRVIRGTDLEQADSSQSFNPNGTQPNPGICRVTPGAGQAGVARLRIQGQNFGAPPPGANDRVVFYNGTQGGAAVSGIDTDWINDTEVSDVLVPQSAENNNNTNPNAPWSGNFLELYLENDGRASNLWNFDVIPPSCAVCTADADCGASQGCGVQGQFNCCADRPIVDAFGPTNPPETCRNAQLSASFTNTDGAAIAMDRTTINPSTVRLRNLTLNVDVPLEAGDFHFPTAASFAVDPGVLDPNTEYRVTIDGDENITEDPAIPEGVLSTGHVGMIGDKTWTFITNDSICHLARVSLSPDAFVFNAFGQTEAVTALTYDETGQSIAPVPGVYDWHWQWTPTSGPVATVTNSDSPDQQITSIGNGGTTVQATAVAGVGWTGSKSGTASVSVSACVNPWPAVPPYEDPEAPSTNFGTWYCRDQGDPGSLDDLPEVRAVAGSHTPSQNGVDELIREFFFEDPTVNPDTNKHDAVGMLVWENEDHLSPAAWYEKKFNKQAPGATSVVDGYQAMRIGTTTYVAGTNLSGGVLYTNMYVFGYNDDAGQETTSIFNQMLSNLSLNTNGSDFAYSGEPDYLKALEQVRRDTKRVADLHDYGQTLAAYGDKNGKFPDLPSGSYIAGMSTSTWPSWDERLTAELRAAVPGAPIPHVDPKNDLTPACTDPFNPATCWDELGKRFFCPSDSHVYAYQAPAGGAAYDMFAHLEYLGQGTWQTGQVNPCTAPSTCDCFNYQLTGAAQGGGNTDTSPPTPPGNLRATTMGTDRIDLAWEVSIDTGGSGVQYYELYRSRDGTSWGSPFAQIAHPNTTNSDTGLSPNTTYYYRAKARDFAGNLSGPSNTAQATTQSAGDVTPPGNVENLNGTAGNGEVTLTWTNPPNPPTDDYAGAQLWYRTGNGTFNLGEGTQVLPNIQPSETTRTITGLTNGTVYTFGIFAYDEVPNYASGAFIQLTPQAGSQLPNNVRNLRATAGDQKVDLFWDSPIQPPPVLAITVAYVRGSLAEFALSDAEWSGDVAPDQIHTVITSLTNDQPYTFGVFSKNDAGYASGAFMQATPQSQATIQNVGGFAATPGDGEIFLTWVNPPAPYTGVMIRRSTTAYPQTISEGTLVADVAAPTESYLNTGLTNGTLYYYSAFAHDNVPNYASGAFAQATPDNGAPNITGVRAPLATITQFAVGIAWHTDEPATTSVEIGLDPNQYEVGRFTDGNYVTDHFLSVPFWPIDLAENTQYHFRVSSQDGAGNEAVDIDHVIVTEVMTHTCHSNPQFPWLCEGIVEGWKGYMESLTVATWNGSANHATCNNSCNQYYTCSNREPNCSDPRNAGIGASNTCGALAIIDCIDNSVSMPQGPNGTLTRDPWEYLSMADYMGYFPMIDYASACQNLPEYTKPYSTPYPQGSWSGFKGTDPAKAKVFGGDGQCTSESESFVDQVRSFTTQYHYLPPM